MTAPFMKHASMLLRDVGVNLLVVAAGVFFLSFSKRYVVGDAANSSVRLGIIFSYLERDTHWSRRNATRPIKLDMPCPNIVLGFLHGVSRIPSWIAAKQYPASRTMARTREIFISRDMKSAALSEGELFSCALSLHADYYLSSSVSFFQIADRVGDFA